MLPLKRVRNMWIADFFYCRFSGFLYEVSQISRFLPRRNLYTDYGAYYYVITCTILFFNLTSLAKFTSLAHNISFARFQWFYMLAMKISLFQHLSFRPVRDKSFFAGLVVSRFSSDSHWFKIWISGPRKVCWFVTILTTDIVSGGFRSCSCSFHPMSQEMEGMERASSVYSSPVNNHW
jgi:hypothetical protein